VSDLTRFEIIEVKVAYLENALNELSDVQLRLQRELDGMRERLQILTERLASVEAPAAASATAHEPPPHY
jgi:uncharacterized coiled-coil protein SlyX